jgi:elongator complex protein 3
VALCIETRPDSCNDEAIKRILEFGATRVELGVQCLDDKIYKTVNRGHLVRDVIEATKKLKNSGFKIGYHMMLGLPGSTPAKDLAMFRKLFNNQDFKPDQIKIYPCQVLKGACLEGWYKKGKYKPYSKDQVTKLIIKIMKLIPNYCRVMRVMREIPPEYLTKGILRIDLRRDIESELHKSKAKINEIRFREIGFAIRDKKPGEKINLELKLKKTKYKASNSTEYFLEIVNKKNILFGLCRLRIFQEEKQKKAFVGDVHVYGQALSIGEKTKKGIQHQGLGQQLIKQAEQIAKKNKIEELKIISGVGVREYYAKKLDYKLKDDYMVKKL